tara:strand:- start:59 stop:547 length:489 start_codon:yes stop_codon:yes gene_type:complete
MRALAIAAAFGSLVVASPALADTNDNFTGLRVGVTAGIDDVVNSPDTTDVVYGVDAGVDFGVGDRVTMGVEAFSTNMFESERTIGAAARLGYAVNEDLLVFTRAGYANYENVFNQNLDGLTVGGGLEYSISDMTYAKVEYRYSDFENNVGNHGALVGIGLRF